MLEDSWFAALKQLDAFSAQVRGEDAGETVQGYDAAWLPGEILSSERDLCIAFGSIYEVLLKVCKLAKCKLKSVGCIRIGPDASSHIMEKCI